MIRERAPQEKASTAGRRRFGWSGLALIGALAPSEAALAQSITAPDESLTWRGITFYGILDIGIQYQTHGAPISDYFSGGSADIVQKNSNRSVFGATPSNLSQSRLGLQGIEPIVNDWSAVFRLETFFNPQSGELSDALKSLAVNNGRSLTQQTTNVDSSVAGQPFQQSLVGVSSQTYGALTFGRQTTVLADGVAKYDPNAASQAFALIGLSGATAGGGDTQDRRLDDSVKYVASYGEALHFGALYKLSQATAGENTAYQVNIGGEYAGLSVDAYYSKVNDGIAAASLSAANIAALPQLGFSPSNSLAATVSDNTAFAIMGLYSLDVLKVFAAYEYIRYANPTHPLPAGFEDIGGYTLAFVNNSAFPDDKILQVYWVGVKYTVIPALELTAAYYGYHQNAYGIGADAGCSSSASGTCSGAEDDISFDADYGLSTHFDAYGGVMYTGVRNGLANGYDLHTTDITSTVGIRYRF